MVIEVRTTLVWGTTAAAVVSAALLASTGGGPRVTGLVDAAVAARPVATARVEAAAPALAGTSSAAPAGPSH